MSFTNYIGEQIDEVKLKVCSSEPCGSHLRCDSTVSSQHDFPQFSSVKILSTLSTFYVFHDKINFHYMVQVGRWTGHVLQDLHVDFHTETFAFTNINEVIYHFFLILIEKKDCFPHFYIYIKWMFKSGFFWFTLQDKFFKV